MSPCPRRVADLAVAALVAAVTIAAAASRAAVRARPFLVATFVQAELIFILQIFRELGASAVQVAVSWVCDVVMGPYLARLAGATITHAQLIALASKWNQALLVSISVPVE